MLEKEIRLLDANGEENKEDNSNIGTLLNLGKDLLLRKKALDITLLLLTVSSMRVSSKTVL